MVTVGVSASGATVTGSVAVVVAVSVPSRLVASTVRTKSSSLSAGGVICKPDKNQSTTSTLCSVEVLVKLLLPSVSVAPSGIAEITID